jgi:hypothetical protein
MLNTINYSEPLKAYMSFISSKPKWYLDFSNKYYSFDENNVLWKHNSNDAAYNELSITPSTTGDITTHFYDNSFISYIVNGEYVQTKTFDNVSFSGDNVESTILDINFDTKTQSSNKVKWENITKREDTYKFAIPRDEAEIMFSSRMRGKFLKSNFLFTTNGTQFTIPYIETTYRHSMI